MLICTRNYVESLIKKECEYSFSVMHGEGDILNAFIRKHRTKR